MRKDVKSFVSLLALTVLFVAAPVASHSSSEEWYECGILFYRYRLNDEPCEYGVKTSRSQRTYVGISVWQGKSLVAGRIQTDPPGILSPEITGPGSFITDPMQMWYLGKGKNQHFYWIDSKNATPEPNAIEFASASSGLPSFIGRIKRNGTVLIGNVVQHMGVMYYVDEYGQTQRTTDGYEVLACVSSRREKKIPPPQFARLSGVTSNVDKEPECINAWAQYKNDKAPETNGISAGLYDCDNNAYVGKGSPLNIAQPGRIQTIGNVGGYFNVRKKLVYLNDSSTFYLVNNEKYTYYWVNFVAAAGLPHNAVYVRNQNITISLAPARVRTTGRTKLGYATPPVANFINDDGTDDEYHDDFEVLVCDPWPKYRCGAQQWKPLTSSKPPADGVNIESVYVGRTSRTCVGGCDYELGRIQGNGVAYLDDLLSVGAFANSSVEYLVQNPSYTYRWAQSHFDEKRVPNAIKVQRAGQEAFYIGSTKVNKEVVIGKVKPGLGLVYADSNGVLRTSSSYKVLVCTSSDASNGVYNQEYDEEKRCDERKEWSDSEKKFVCKDEFRQVFADANSQWSEASCSYVGTAA